MVKRLRPQLTGKTLGEIKALLRAVPLDRAMELIRVYCQMDEDWFNTKQHDFTTFTNNLNGIAYALDTGNVKENKDWDYIFGRKDKK